MSTAPHATGLDSLFGLQDKTALIVDNGGNAGKDIAIALARAGAAIIYVDRDASLVEAAVEAAQGAGGQATGMVANVEQEAEVKDLFKRIDASGAPIDIFVSACGLVVSQPLTEMTLELWDEAQSGNLRCVFLCVREVLGRMAASGNGGRLVIISTIGALTPCLHHNGAYGPPRAGAVAMTKTIALDYGQYGIRANCILPGAIPGRTFNHPVTLDRMAQKLWPTGPGADPTRIPVGAMGDGIDIGAAVVFFAGPSAGFITGQVLALDGGFLIS
jgi:NAD(P)-dependent dehydrogenase (short-subunit alcohol dehydrogenase family)